MMKITKKPFQDLLKNGNTKLFGISITVSVLIGLFATNLMPATYHAQSLLYLRVSNKAPVEYKDPTGTKHSYLNVIQNQRAYTAFRVSTYLFLLHTPDEYERISKEAGYKLDPSLLDIYFVSGTNLLTIAITSDDPVKSAKLANATTDELIRLITELELIGSKLKFAPTVGTKLIQQANAETEPVAPLPLRNFLLSIYVGILSGFIWKRYQQSNKKTISSYHDVEALVELKCFGTFPDLQKGLQSSNFLTTQEFMLEEQIRRFRTSLNSIIVDKQKNLFLLCSTTPGEGTDFFAEQVAKSFIGIGKSVCLLQADQLKDEKLNLSDFIVHDVSLYLVQETKFKHFEIPVSTEKPTYLVSPLITNRPNEVLQSKQFTSLLQHLQSQFELVLIIGAPLLAFSDSAIIAQYCDETFYVVKHQKPVKQQVINGMQGLNGVGIRPIGFVYTGAPLEDLNLYGKDADQPEVTLQSDSDSKVLHHEVH